MRQKQLDSVCVMGKVEDRRGRGRPRIQLVRTLARSVGGSTRSTQLLHMINGRFDWSSMLPNVYGEVR